MCGIAGIISPDPETRIGAALLAIEHRGRDDEGVFVSEGVAGAQLTGPESSIVAAALAVLAAYLQQRLGV